MEHRWSRRQICTHRVVIDGPRTGAVIAQMRDMNLDGMFVAAGAIRLPLYAPVVLAFGLPRDGKVHHFRFDAMVVRQTARGSGLMFLDLDSAVIRSLRAGLYETPAVELAPPAVATSALQSVV